jgi:hypothetical protein
LTAIARLVVEKRPTAALPRAAQAILSTRHFTLPLRSRSFVPAMPAKAEILLSDGEHMLDTKKHLCAYENWLARCGRFP